MAWMGLDHWVVRTPFRVSQAPSPQSVPQEWYDLLQVEQAYSSSITAAQGQRLHLTINKDRKLRFLYSMHNP